MIRLSIPARRRPIGFPPLNATLAAVLAALLIGFLTQPGAAADWENQIAALAGSGGVLVEDGQGNTILSINPDRPLVPASTLKVVTAAAALELLDRTTGSSPNSVCPRKATCTWRGMATLT